MRTLVVSDIHGNWPALEAVAAVPHDAVVCLGDIVGYGPQPAECLRWLRASGAEIVQGNHDRALAVGHTHLPFHFRFGGVDVLNPGSLGQPKDGDPRAAYGIIEDGVPRLERKAYPIERTIEGLEAAGLDPAPLGALSVLLRTGMIR